MRFWQALAFTETDQLLDLARICEAVGFHGVSVSDHVYAPEKFESKYPYSEDGAPPFDAATEWPECWATISAMAAVTSSLCFTSGVYIAPLRHPLLVARSVSTAAVLSGGRVALGAGIGWLREEFDQLGQDFATRGRRLDEMLEVLRKVWAGGMVEHHGVHYDFDRLQLSPGPPAPIPIWIGGTSEAALRRAARNDGWVSSGDAPDRVLDQARRVLAHRREAGRSAEGFELISSLGAPPDLGLFQRMEEAGITGIVNPPLGATLGRSSSLAQKRDALERFAERFIVPLS